MPQRQKTEAYQVSLEDLPDIGAEREKFVDCLLRGMSGADAYRAAFKPAETTKDESIYVRASRIRHEPDVKEWLRAARIAAAERSAWNVERLVSELEVDREEAKASGNYGASIDALKTIGKASGLFIERHEDLTGASWDIKDIQTQDIPSLIQVLQHQLGALQGELERRQAIALNDAVGEHVGSTQQ